MVRCCRPVCVPHVNYYSHVRVLAMSTLELTAEAPSKSVMKIPEVLPTQQRHLLGSETWSTPCYAPLCLIKSMCTILVPCFIDVLYCLWIQHKNGCRQITLHSFAGVGLSFIQLQPVWEDLLPYFCHQKKKKASIRTISLMKNPNIKKLHFYLPPSFMFWTNLCSSITKCSSSVFLHTLLKLF